MSKDKSSSRLYLLPAFVSFLLIAASILLWRSFADIDAQLAEQSFNHYADESLQAMQQSLTQIDSALRASDTVFDDNRSPTREQWERYVNGSELFAHSSGLKGVGYLTAESATTKPGEVAASSYVTQQLLPDTRDNRSALGYRVAIGDALWPFLQKAANDHDIVAVWSKVSGAQNVQLVLYWPIFDTLPEAAGAIGSWPRAYSFVSLNAQNFLHALFAERAFSVAWREPQADIAVRFAPAESAQHVPRYNVRRLLKFGGHESVLEFSSAPSFERLHQGNSAWRVLSAGMLLSVLIGLLLWSQAVSALRDKLKQAQLTEELLQREQRFSTLIEGAPNAMLMVDARGVIEMCNAQAEHLFGYPRDELVGQSIEILVPEAHRYPHYNSRHHYQQAPTARRMGSGRDLYARRKDGSEVSVEIGLSPVQTESGLKTISSIVDLSERRLAENQFRQVVEAAPNAIFVVNESGRIELVNSQAEHLFGYARSELLGEPIDKLVPDQFRGHHQQLRDAYVRSPMQRRMGGTRELFARHKDGHDIPVEVGLAPLRVGANTLIQAVVIDISARKEIEQRLKEQADELAQSSQYKSQFLANMSHELRTPLNSILILSEHLKQNRDGYLRERDRMHAEIIHRSGSDLLHLINEILDLSKIEAGQMRLRPERFPLRDLLRNIGALFAPLAESKHIVFTTDIDASVPEFVYADQQRLQQVLSNLVGNAIKFTEAGCVRIDVKCVDNRSLEFSVSDTGIGIAADKLGSIFEAFRQVDSSSSRRFQGSGLGLAISRQLAKLMNATITVDSQPGEGSIFHFHMPFIVPDELVTSDEGAGGIRMLGPMDAPTLLIVEDDSEFAQVLADTVLENGFSVHMTSSGVAAMEIAQKQIYSAIILDILLPDISGWQVLHQLRTQSATRDTPVHILSCMQQPPDWNDKRSCYLVKPVQRADLERLLSQIRLRGPATDLKILLVEDNDVERAHYRDQLGSLGCEVTEARNAGDALVRYASTEFDCLIVDLSLPDEDGFLLLKQLDELRSLSTTRVIVHTSAEVEGDALQTLANYSASVVHKSPHGMETLARSLQSFVNSLSGAAMTETVPETEQHGERRVLLVDDDVRNVYALCAMLEDFSWNVLTAHNGEEALRLLAVNRVDVVLLDMSMPVMDGYATLHELHKNPHWKTPVIALTAHAMKGDQEKCLSAGADDYLSKPIAENDLLAKLDRWTQQKGVGNHASGQPAA